MPTSDKAIDAIFDLIRTFDFERIEKTMIALDWKWSILGENLLRTPRIYEMKNHCINLLIAADRGIDTFSSGGFEAACKINDQCKKVFTLRFVAAEKYVYV